MNIYALALILAIHFIVLMVALGILYNSFKALARGEGSYDPQVRKENLVSIWVGVLLSLIVIASLFKRCVF